MIRTFKDKPVEFRQKAIGNTLYLQVRAVASKKNIFSYIISKLFYNWSFIYVCISNPYKENAGDEELAYTLMKCGEYGVDEFDWFVNNIHTMGEFDRYVDEIERKAFER